MTCACTPRVHTRTGTMYHSFRGAKNQPATLSPLLEGFTLWFTAEYPSHCELVKKFRSGFQNQHVTTNRLAPSRVLLRIGSVCVEPGCIVVPKATDNALITLTKSLVISSVPSCTIVWHQTWPESNTRFNQPIQRENKDLTSLFDYM